MDALNSILYGPPGTGKTYETRLRAIAICGFTPLDDVRNLRPSDIQARFLDFVKRRCIGFATFHQSYGYEEFIEGIRANTDNGSITYNVRNGSFKRIARRALFDWALYHTRHEVSGSDIEQFRKIYRDFRDVYSEMDGMTARGYFDEHKEMIPLYLVERFMMFADYEALCTPPETTKAIPTPNYVFVIDEINRGNISKIFGELITLIEPSKRAGSDEALPINLPYSGEPFIVPPNLYIIGTANTADRSLTQIDLALRRRFQFQELLPKAELLPNDIDGINIQEILDKMNKRIEVLAGRDHMIGHSYFWGLKKEGKGMSDLADVMKQNIIPLLQEYFYDDWKKIRFVLGDNQKPSKESQFITEKEVFAPELFGPALDDLNLSPDNRIVRFQINDRAFSNPGAYAFLR